MKKPSPIALLRELFGANPEVDDFTLVTAFYEEYVRMSCELAAIERMRDEKQEEAQIEEEV